MSVHPILFNTEMVRAILAGHKTETRRLIKEPYFIDPSDEEKCRIMRFAMHRKTKAHDVPYLDAPYVAGDILYVRETWAIAKSEYGGVSCAPRYIYRADFNEVEAQGWKWKPSIHMPKDAARLFLRVDDVLVERLQDITGAGAEREGAIVIYNPLIRLDPATYNSFGRTQFARLWESTLNKKYVDKYGWAANPWVWVIKFSVVDKKEVMT